jgi:hypothetical protein
MSAYGGGTDGCRCSVALEGRRGQAYNEEAFRYFLAIERKRSERSGRPVILLLVDVNDRPEARMPIDSMLARRLFSGLWRCLRDSDFVGWYREGRVAGAVLTESRNRPRTEVARLVSQRVRETLCAHVPSDVARRLRVRVHQDREAENIEPVPNTYGAPPATGEPDAHWAQF